MARMGDPENATLRISEAAAYLGIASTTLRVWVERGYVKCARSPGGQRRFAPAELDRVIAAAAQRGERS